MIKLKNILSEGFAWERKEGKGLPTMAEVQAEYEKNEAVSQEEADKRWNDPIQMGMRNTSMPRNAVPASSMSTPQKAPNNFYREKITALEAQRKQLEFDMEQEAEPEGGPVADYYGEQLQIVDELIDSIKQKMNTNESIEEAQDKVSSRTHVVYACNVELANGSIKPGVRISVPKGNDAEKQVRDKIMARFGKDCKIRSMAKGQNPHNNDNDVDESMKSAAADSTPHGSGNLNRVDKKKSLKVGDVTTFSSGKYKGKKVKIIKVLDNGKYELELVTEDKADKDYDLDGDGKWYEPGDDVKENVNESFVSRLKKNLLGGAVRK